MTAQAQARTGSIWAGAFTRSEALRGWTLLSPTVIVMVAGLAAPLAIMLLYSFWKQDGYVVDTTLTAHNYAYALDRYQPIFIRSLWISGVVTLFTVLLAYPIAYY
ncbi:MAG: ABC transporter permease, partial [Alphaproteobacteria bacterium]|nr:ABC transporter permease [Alphaproteobacteria bacterium]